MKLRKEEKSKQVVSINPETKAAYKQQNVTVQRVLRRDKQRIIEEQCQMVEGRKISHQFVQRSIQCSQDHAVKAIIVKTMQPRPSKSKPTIDAVKSENGVCSMKDFKSWSAGRNTVRTFRT